MVEKGHFVVYSSDEKRFVLPLEYLKNKIVMELFQLAEEEFGLQGNEHITLPCDTALMEYVIGLIKRKAYSKRHVVPLSYLRNNIFLELLKLSEEELLHQNVKEVEEDSSH
ncbi:Auxin-responsive protein SAUR62 [Hibiscus syriacus]|uniref:Auxin-responsive protein SAUR62 n=1 Tax=Hibiscus syriacus TaxID=106335 RepID=A0A6A3BRT2_HIBSY|nr:Auxin-responsive protein SAUR62 [Hibiscus syriacus]